MGIAFSPVMETFVNSHGSGVCAMIQELLSRSIVPDAIADPRFPRGSTFETGVSSLEDA